MRKMGESLRTVAELRVKVYGLYYHFQAGDARVHELMGLCRSDQNRLDGSGFVDDRWELDIESVFSIQIGYHTIDVMLKML